MLTGSLASKRITESHTKLLRKHIGKAFSPAFFRRVPCPFLSLQGHWVMFFYLLRHEFIPLPLSSRSLCSAPPKLAFTTVNGPLLSPSDRHFDERGLSGFNGGHINDRRNPGWFIFLTRLVVSFLFVGQF